MSSVDFIKILLVEDNEGDIRLAREALTGSKVRNELQVIKDGQEALDYLFQNGEYEKSSRPDLILLDLNLPKINGKEVLKKIKANEDLKRIPIIILTTSSSHDDIIETYSNYANSFITKPLDWEQFINVIKSIEDFWLTIVKLPDKSLDN